MYILCQGEVEVSQNLILREYGRGFGTKDKIITRLKGEEFPLLGEIGLLGDNIRSATVTALANCQLWVISKADFEALAEADPQLGYKVLQAIAKVLCSRLKKANQDILKLTTALSIALS